MQRGERWLLPDGVDEVLPPEAQALEQLRRQILDLFESWGYELVVPPLVEFSLGTVKTSICRRLS
jgi:ATP phosphoribosyltransferase regulatory subunit